VRASQKLLCSTLTLGGVFSVFPLTKNSGARWWSPFPHFCASRAVMLWSLGYAKDGTMGVRPKSAEGCFGTGYAGMWVAGLGRAMQ